MEALASLFSGALGMVADVPHGLLGFIAFILLGAVVVHKVLD
jgi:hypothetical protein